MLFRAFYILFLALLAGSAVCSNFMMNLAWTLLFVNWLVERDFKRKFADFRTNGLLHFAIFYFLLSALSLIWTRDLYAGLDVLRQTLPLLVVPLVVLTSRPLTRLQWRLVAIGYVGTLLVVTVIGFIRWLTIPDLPYRQIVPFISHIRFSLNLVFAIILLLFAVLKAFDRRTFLSSPLLYSVALLLALWFVFYLFLLQSYTGLIILIVTSLVSIFFGFRHLTMRPLRWTLVLAALFSVLVFSGIVVYYVNDYYTPRLAHVDRSRVTRNGNPYSFARDGLVECGRYVNDFVCEEELRAEWPKVSRMSVDSLTPVGYPVLPALVRYLNAMGVTKDSAGVASLTKSDIAAIEQGVANPVYAQSTSLRRMVYVMLFEYENYRCYHNVKGFTMLQRFELWKEAWSIACDNWLYGVGVGSVRSVLESQLMADQSPLADRHMMPHNQYLTILLTFGAILSALLLVCFIWALVSRRNLRNPLFLACLVIVLLSCLTEDTLQTCAGALFVSLFLSLTSSRTTNGKLNENEQP
ncbi:MAG: O-antigen ligase family protein [Bacteroidales bacterium]|nr:O-antigen ligase family protein [Bacteroidales bacterium]